MVFGILFENSGLIPNLVWMCACPLFYSSYPYAELHKYLRAEGCINLLLTIILRLDCHKFHSWVENNLAKNVFCSLAQVAREEGLCLRFLSEATSHTLV
jgi:hypothetical protein